MIIKSKVRALIAAAIVAVLSGCSTIPHDGMSLFDEQKSEFGGGGGVN